MLEEHHAVGSLLFMYICSLYRRLKRDQPVELTEPEIQQPHQHPQSDGEESIQHAINFDTYSPGSFESAEIQQPHSDEEESIEPAINFESYSKFKKRPGSFERVFLPMKEQNGLEFFKNTCMNAAMFDSLVSMIKEELMLSNVPKEITVEERLAMTLTFLAKGVSYNYIVRAHKLDWIELVRTILLETSEALWKALQPIYFAKPTEAKYSELAKGFLEKWHLPYCVGAVTNVEIILATSIRITEHNNVILMATCDTNYKLTSVSIGNNGQFSSSSYGHALLENILPLPGTGQRTVDNPSFPYYFAGDYSFPLLNNLMRPFPGLELSKRRRIFNYRLSRGHQVIENTLGIIVARWHIFKKSITAKSTECKKFVLAVCALHNFIMSNDSEHIYCPEKYADWEDENHIIKKGDWRKELESRSNNPAISYSKCFIQKSSPTAFKQREDLAKYFENNGAVEFQYEARGIRT
ncbi:uncharacterized protein LOC105232067 [Bactrocera dorsalis]|uniref:Uncharacterized protein LOC105232067 n=1 Tax=Bactrocera dorsalis TaxID=27457 RepID=A0A6I9VMW6_BACDO|nr:uncharacterized protein LOC105232067 [Bactrocera dorsalis]